MKIISWNVNGLRSVWKKGFKDFVTSQKPDILCLQETKADHETIDSGNFQIDGYHLYRHSAKKKGYSGVMVYSIIKPKTVERKIFHQHFDDEGRLLLLEFDKFYLADVYLPHSGRMLEKLDKKSDFNNAFLDFCEQKKVQIPLVIAGDFNVAHKPIDLANPKQNEKNAGFTVSERKWFDKMLLHGYIDTFREFDKSSNNYTWWSYRFNARLRNIGWRIDYILTDKVLIKHLKSSFILKDVMGSDHCPVGIEIKF